jgi:hypothetical protein
LADLHLKLKRLDRLGPDLALMPVGQQGQCLLVEATIIDQPWPFVEHDLDAWPFDHLIEV